MTNVNFLLTISIHNQEKRLWDLIKWSLKGKYFDRLSNSLHKFFKEKYGDQSGELAATLSNSFFRADEILDTDYIRVTRQQAPYCSAVLASIFISTSKPFFLKLNLAPAGSLIWPLDRENSQMRIIIIVILASME